MRCRFTRVYEAELLYTWRYTCSGHAEAYRKSRTPAKINVYLYPNVCTEELVLDEPAPPTQPPAEQCHASYAGVCLLPSASDYDCAGGSGDGPYYVTGPFNVVGPDVYALDSDGDGIGCE